MTEKITKEWLEETMQEAIARWQPTNADLINFETELYSKMEVLIAEVERLRKETTELIKQVKLERKAYAKAT